MAKNAQRRVYDKLTPEKQQMFLTAKAINEIITDRDSPATAVAKLKRFMEVNRFDWDAYLALIRSKLNNSTSSLVYSPQEKIMLYILVYAYLSRVTGKAIILPDNLSYISLSNINLLFNNERVII